MTDVSDESVQRLTAAIQGLTSVVQNLIVAAHLPATPSTPPQPSKITW